MIFRCFFVLNVIMLNLTLGLPRGKCSFLCLLEKKKKLTSSSIITHFQCALLLNAQTICYTFVISIFKIDNMDSLNATNIHCNVQMCFNVRIFILSRHLLLFDENFNFTAYSLNFFNRNQLI